MAARFCPNCRQEVSATARFCNNCASPLPDAMAAVPPPTVPGLAPPPTQMDVALHNSRRALMVVLIAALVVMTIAVAVLVGKLNSSVVSATPPALTPVPPVITAVPTPVPASPPVISVQTTPAPATPPVITAQNPAPGVFPPDVDAYLKFLKGIEDRRVALAKDFSGTGAMMDVARDMQTMGQTNPDEGADTAPKNISKLNQGYGAYSTKWQTLAHDFEATTPPTDCSLLANNYGKYLTDYVSVVSKLQVMVANLDQNNNPDNMQALQDAQNIQSQGITLLTSDGLAADGDLGNLCTRFNAPRPFSIQPEGATPSVLGQ